MQVLIQLRTSASAPTTRAIPEASLAAAVERVGVGFTIDSDYEPVDVPSPRAPEEGAPRFSLSQPLEFADTPGEATRVVRATVAEGDLDQRIAALTAANPDVVGVFADPAIESCAVCPDGPIGTYRNVAKVLGVKKLHDSGMTGRNVPVAIVDSGINKAHLVARGQEPTIDARNSWSPRGVTTRPGRHPVDHGTMCAYDVGIAAPGVRFLDHALLLSTTEGETVMSGFLSDALVSYGRLLRWFRGQPANRRRLVVNNSWGMFSPRWDFPVGHPGNYSDNPAHPFNVIVASLERAGADILFAAGNCGRDCPDGRCEFGHTRPVCGANSHPRVLSVAGIDYRKRRIGYSSQGPGRLAAQKPDIAAYTAFTGSEVYPEGDGGTSAACPVAAGVVAAVRTKYSSAKVSPGALRSVVYKTAEDLGGTGYDYDHGWGAVNPEQLVAALARAGRQRSR